MPQRQPIVQQARDTRLRPAKRTNVAISIDDDDNDDNDNDDDEPTPNNNHRGMLLPNHRGMRDEELKLGLVLED